MRKGARKAIGVDVGGTKISAGVVDEDGVILSSVRYPSAGSPEVLLKNIVRAVKEAVSGHDGSADDIGGTCLAVPGLILSEKNTVVFSPNLPAIEGIDLRAELAGEVGLRMNIENDANAAAWGEFRFGAGRDARHLVFVTLGTGVGGGVITHGVLMRGAQGSGGELGHTTIQAEGGPLCSCENVGCLEALASGTAITRRGNDAAAENPDSALAGIASKRRVRGEDVTELAAKGDEAALSVLAETGRWLGVGLAGFVNVFNPEVVAIGGGAAAGGEMILASAREEVARRSRPPSRDLARIMSATLGADSGLIGAAALARNPDDPDSGDYVPGG